MNFKNILLYIFLALPFLGLTQKDMYEKGRIYYDAKQYSKALEYFYADKFATNNKELLIRRIICNFETGKLENAKKDVAKILTFENYPPETFFMIGRIYHSEGNYKKAAVNYKNYLRLAPKAKNKEEVIHLIKQCGEARKLKYIEAEAYVDNYGTTINTEYDEFRMIQSPNYPDKYYFSSAREGSNGGRRDDKGKRDDSFGFFNSDMYTIEMENGEWRPARALNPFINSSRDELALDFSSNGSILFYMKGGSYEEGEIYTDTFTVNKKEVLEPSALVAPIDASIGDTWLHLFNDKTILFASKRPGGYGGYDLYVTYFIDGNWSKPKNMGPDINSEYNEISPSISNDGNILYFSSDRVESFGGYDVFKSTYDSSSESWTESKNVGNPVNSAGNEIGMYLSSDGKSAYLSSDRKQGFGGYDLYIVYFKNQILGQLNRNAEFAFISNDEFVPYTSKRTINNRGSKASSENKKKEEKSVNKVSKSTPEKVKQEAAPSKTKDQKIASAQNKKEVEKVTPKKESTTSKPANKKPAFTKRKKTKADKKKTRNSEKEKKISEFVINPVFYEPNKDIINPTARKELDVIIELMQQYNTLELIIQAHTVEDGMEAVDLYFSIKRAEQIGKYLVQNGVTGNRILLKGYGSNYPIGKTEAGGSPSKIGQRVNSRIDFDFKNTELLPIKITLVEPYLVDYLRDPRGELFKTVEDGLSYRVQIASVGQMYQNQVLLLYNDSMIERGYLEKNYRYTLGLYESYIDAEKLVKDLENYNVTGAFIVPYINGRRLSKENYQLYTSQYPDLLKFTEKE